MLTPGSRVGLYEIVGSIGAGGMGEVYRARDAQLQRDVAIKVLPASVAADPDRLARFQREARALASLNHPHIAQVYGFESGGSAPILVMELVPGDTLDARVHAHAGGLPIDEVMAIAQQLAEALEAAHEQGIVHRDLKPANIKLTPDGSVKVLDFGLAKAIEGAGQAGGAGRAGRESLTQSPTITSPAMTQAGIILGTAAYMAPEQARGKPVDKRADIWAFGCVLFELLSGKAAFDGESVTDILSAVVSKDPVWTALPAATPAPMRSLLERCLEKDPRKRLRDIGEARIALARSDSAPVDRHSPPPPSHAWRERAAWTMAALATVAALALLLSPRATPGPARHVQSAVRMAVDLQPGLRLVTYLPPVLSPDGTRIALRGDDGAGAAIWVHDLQSGGAARRLAGTEVWSGGLIWAPDNTAIAFFSSARTLKAVDLVSGTVRTIGTVPADMNPPSGAWSARGEIVVGGGSSPLYRIPAGGGVATALTTLGTGEFGHYFPTFLPDGDRFFFGVNHGPGVSTLDDDGRVASLTEPGRAAASVSGGLPAFVAPDWLVIQKNDLLVAQRLDMNTLTLVGEPQPLPVRLSAFNGVFGYSVTPGLLAFRTMAPSEKRRFAWYDRSGVSKGTLAAPDDAQGVELSPDGVRLMFETLEPGLSSRDLSVATVASGDVRRVVFESADESDAKWLPDSKTIVFASRRENEGPIMRMDLDSTEPPRPIAGIETTAGQYPLSLSREGQLLVFIRLGGFFITPLDPLRPAPLGLKRIASASRIKMSSDGKWAAYESGESGRAEIYVEPVPPSGASWPVSRDGGSTPRWHPNGREIYFVSQEGALMAVSLQTTPTVTLSPPAPLFQTQIALPTRSGVHANYDVAADGRFLIVENTGPPATTANVQLIVNWQSLLPATR